MSVFALPIDADSSTHLPAFVGQAHRVAQAALIGAGSSRAVGARSGRRPGPGLELTATSSVWTVQPGCAIVDTAFSSTSGPYLVAVDTVTTGSMTPADSSNPRIDAVYLKVDDAAVDGGGNRRATLNYLAGTAAAVPSAPALPSGALLVGTITVPKATTGSPSTTMSSLFAVASGGILPIADSTARAGLTTYAGLAVFRLDTKVIEVHNGTGWDAFVKATDLPVLGSASGTVGASGFATITHGLGFTPSRVFAQATILSGTSASDVLGVDTRTSTTFRIRFNGGVAGDPFAIDWQAYR